MVTIRNGAAAVVNATRPAYEYGQPAKLLLDSGQTNAFFHFGLPSDLRVPATILTATVRIPQGEGATWTGSRTLTLRRLVESWTVGGVNWNNQPAVTTDPGTSVTASNTGSSNVWEFSGPQVVADIQDFINTGRNYGWRLATGDTTGRYVSSFHAPKLKPTLELTYNYSPPVPTTLHPSAGAVSIAFPVLTWDAERTTADTSNDAQVQIDPAANAVSPAYDSGWVPYGDDAQFATALHGYAGLANGATTKWRVRVRRDVGHVSPWSTWATFNRVNKPVLTLTSPTTTFSDQTPTVDWTFSAPQTAYRVDLFPVGPEYADRMGDYKGSGRVASALTEYQVTQQDRMPAEGISWKFRVRAWDNVDREATPGDPTYAEVSTTAVLSYNPAVTAVDWITLDQASPAPWVDVKWSRSSAPDGWMIERDGQVVYRTAIAGGPLVSGTVYVWRDHGASPNREHTYRVAPITNGTTAKGGPTDTILVPPRGVWLADPTAGLEAVLWGQDEGTWAYGEDSTVYYPIGGTAPVRVTSSMRGLEGTMTGQLFDVDEGFGVPECRAALLAMKADPSRVLRLVAGDINIPVVVHNLAVFPSPLTEPGQRTANVSFEFEQTGELPFDTDV